MDSKALELIVFVLVAFGIVFGIGQTKLTYPFRKWLSRGGPVKLWMLLLLECVFCLGFHLGWIAVCFHLAPYFSHDLRGGIECAFFTASACLVVAHFAGVTEHD